MIQKRLRIATLILSVLGVILVLLAGFSLLITILMLGTDPPRFSDAFSASLGLLTIGLVTCCIAQFPQAFAIVIEDLRSIQNSLEKQTQLLTDLLNHEGD